MKVQNMTSSKGNKVANQFIIEDTSLSIYHPALHRNVVIYGTVFQSYSSVIALKTGSPNNLVYLDKNYWDYSRTTAKYRNQFLGEPKAETQKKIDSGEYILTDLN
jgi:hypothetical protein